MTIVKVDKDYKISLNKFKIERERTYKDILRMISEVSIKAMKFVGKRG
jgi:hypothetical protein